MNISITQMSNDIDTRIVISIATYNRPSGLKTVLDGIEAQNVPKRVHLRVVIVDNSIDANAHEYVERRSRIYRWPLTYYHEAKRGISFARNKGLEVARHPKNDYIALIDDDEWPEENWIEELLHVAEDTNATAVIGAVRAKFQTPPPWWIISGRFLESPEFPDRSPISYGHTCNALVRLRSVRSLDLWFDSRYALTGGEDTVFFQILCNSGGKIVFAKNAITHECIVPSRATLTHFSKFWYRTGNTDAIIGIRSKNTNLWSRFWAIRRGLTRALIGTLGTIFTLPTLLFKRIYLFNYLRTALRGLGYLTAAFGMKFEEYRNHDR